MLLLFVAHHHISSPLSVHAHRSNVASVLKKIIMAIRQRNEMEEREKENEGGEGEGWGTARI